MLFELKFILLSELLFLFIKFLWVNGLSLSDTHTFHNFPIYCQIKIEKCFIDNILIYTKTNIQQCNINETVYVRLG